MAKHREHGMGLFSYLNLPCALDEMTIVQAVAGTRTAGRGEGQKFEPVGSIRHDTIALPSQSCCVYGAGLQPDS